MAIQQHFPFLSIFIAIISSILTAVMRNSKVAKALNFIALLSIIVMSGLLIQYLLVSDTSYFVYNLGPYTSPWVNTLSASLVEAVLALVFTVVMLLSLAGGMRESDQDIEKHKHYLYYLFQGLLFASLLVLVYTNDIFTAYVFLEINTIAACSIIVLKENGETIRATIKYFVMTAVGSGFFLFTIAMLYGITGNLAMDALNESITVLFQTGEYQIPLLISLTLFFVSLAIKSAVFPFHNWLPDAHGSATSPSSAILSGLVLKGYIVLFIKIVYRVYGIEVVQGLNLFPVIFGLGIVSMIMGSVLALMQNDIKKMIAYSSVAQMGYIYAGIGLGTHIGLLAALFHIITHAITKPALFLSAGKIIQDTNIRDVREFNGVGKKLPILMGIFTVGSLSMIGIPPSVGFSSKWALAVASLDTHQYWMIIFITISTLLNIAYYLPIIIRSFVGKDNEVLEGIDQAGFSAGYIPIIILAALIVLLGIFSGSIFEMLSQGIAAW